MAKKKNLCGIPSYPASSFLWIVAFLSLPLPAPKLSVTVCKVNHPEMYVSTSEDFLLIMSNIKDKYIALKENPSNSWRQVQWNECEQESRTVCCDCCYKKRDGQDEL